MSTSIARNLRCQWRPLAISLMAAAAMTGFLCLCALLCAPVNAIGLVVAGCFGPFVAASWLLMGIGFSLNFYTQYAFLYLMLGTTRAGVFAARQLSTLCYCGVGALVTAAGVWVNGLWTAGVGDAAIAFFAGLFLLCQLTEICGLLAYRYGKWGMIFYGLGICLLCGISGSFITMLVAGDHPVTGVQELFLWTARLPLIAAGGVMLAGGVIIAAMSWFFFRRAQVKA